MALIYCVEDDDGIRELISCALKSGGYEVKAFPKAKPFYEEIRNKEPSLVLLDIMLPDEDGYSILSKLKKDSHTQDVPVIMLTAKSSELDKVSGLEMGADDYITKPFNPLEVTARVKTVLRRCRRGAETNDEMDIRGLTINRASRRCSLFGRELSLTPTEFDILWYLCDNAGRVVASEELFEAVWKEKFLTSSSNTVMAHIGRLREKMHEPARKPKFIKTVWGVGYEIEN